MKQKKVQLKKNDNTICESEKFTTKNTKMKYPIKKNIRTSKISLTDDIKGKHNLNILYKTKNMNKGVKGKKNKFVRVKKKYLPTRKNLMKRQKIVDRSCM